MCWAKRSRAKGRPPLSLISQPLPLSRVIIKSEDRDLERISTDFMECKVRQYNEHSLTLICCDSIILRDGWVENAFADKMDLELIITSVRRDRWKPQNKDQQYLEADSSTIGTLNPTRLMRSLSTCSTQSIVEDYIWTLFNLRSPRKMFRSVLT